MPKGTDAYGDGSMVERQFNRIKPLGGSHKYILLLHDIVLLDEGGGYYKWNNLAKDNTPPKRKKCLMKALVSSTCRCTADPVCRVG